MISSLKYLGNRGEIPKSFLSVRAGGSSVLRFIFELLLLLSKVTFEL